ncbi:MAG: NrdH-redoxin [Hamadaea sp.]|uniref:glutaredoxin domain-containing protein n=1 Tax=Hamadaea sp. TaxID=2024425 RepID=UPI0017B67E0B|nr:glutaredoxin domain-containing protein [Hamadaea sp.]NUR72174.1 NrdH-redoxin [Hamadaea sp.]NUT22741.1 NrdH-redoxin [Hamadaea sp.]
MTDTLTVYGATWCGDCVRTKRFLDRNGVEYAWIDTDADDNARDYVQRVQDGRMSIPVVALPDGRHLVEPADKELAEALGLAWP